MVQMQRTRFRIVRPETVIAWHRRGWRLYWTWRSRRRGPGRPTVPRQPKAHPRDVHSQCHVGSASRAR
jgi:hypothetical protein